MGSDEKDDLRSSPQQAAKKDDLDRSIASTVPLLCNHYIFLPSLNRFLSNMKTCSRSSMTTNSHRVKWLVWLVASSFLMGNTNAQDPSNSTAAPCSVEEAPRENENEIALYCGNERVSQFSGFAVSVGGTPPSIFSVWTTSTVVFPYDALDRPVCGGVTPGGKGYWFPVSTGSHGEIDLLFCTMTETALTITPTVYQAPRRVSEYVITKCEDLTCVAIGTKHPVKSVEEEIRSEGDLCPNATNSGGVHFTASKDELYFVHVDVTTDLTEISGFEVISFVTKSCSSHSLNIAFRWMASIATMLLFGWM